MMDIMIFFFFLKIEPTITLTFFSSLSLFFPFFSFSRDKINAQAGLCNALKAPSGRFTNSFQLKRNEAKKCEKGISSTTVNTRIILFSSYSRAFLFFFFFLSIFISTSLNLQEEKKKNHVVEIFID